ncbi:MAG: transketolase [Candidatus Zixiibacteriota bacterium]
MPLVDSATGRVVRELSVNELRERASYMRGLNLIALCAAGSGHSGGTLGVMDIAAALYLRIARHDPRHPEWPDRDRIVWSAGHKAPALYTALAVSGYYPEKEVVRLRQLDSPFQGHPHRLDLPGVEFTTGSLGQGLSLGVGSALAARLNDRDYRVFVICSDGEQQEGSIWEAAMSAAHHQLGNLIAVIDCNRLQIDGPIVEVMNIEPLADKYRAFGWNVLNADGHDIADLVENLEGARCQALAGKPIAVICHTNKGRGVSFMENEVGWHGKPPNRKELELALAELGATDKFNVDDLLAYAVESEKQVEVRLTDAQPRFSRNYWWNAGENMRVEMKPTRAGFGQALDKFGDDPRIVCIGADISDSICISDFYKNHPERKPRFISAGIAEQNATGIVAGLAREGKIPVFGTYGVFASARNLDQLRISVCYANLNVLIVGAHGGISVGPDGATHQELEAMFQITGLPNMHMGVPCDIVETEKMTRALLLDVVGPKYLRFAREATPIITDESTPFRFGEGLIFRFRHEADHFARAFECHPASEYRSEGEDITIISCGPETTEAMRAAWILRTDLDLETRVLHLHTVKPLDEQAIRRAAEETGGVVTAEEHQVGGLGNRVAGVIAQRVRLRGKSLKFAMIGVPDRFGQSGRPWQLIRKLGLTAEHIAAQVKVMLGV